MTKFKVYSTRTHWYETEVEAPTEKEAWTLANERSKNVKWRRDARMGKEGFFLYDAHPVD